MMIILIDAWRIGPAKRKDISNDPPPLQMKYHTHYRAMVIKVQALPFSENAGFQPTSICTAACTDIECA
eukprot:scaffold147033_cov23-Tisochrysis_lutea.AAC.1